MIARQDKRAGGAPKVDKVVDGGKYGDALEADILISKYADGLPLHRQRERYARLGLDMPISTLVHQVRSGGGDDDLTADAIRRLTSRGPYADAGRGGDHGPGGHPHPPLAVPRLWRFVAQGNLPRP